MALHIYARSIRQQYLCSLDHTSGIPSQRRSRPSNAPLDGSAISNPRKILGSAGIVDYRAQLTVAHLAVFRSLRNSARHLHHFSHSLHVTLHVSFSKYLRLEITFMDYIQHKPETGAKGRIIVGRDMP